MLTFIKKHSELLDEALKYSVALVLLAVPLYPKFPFITIPGTFVAIRLEDFLLFFVFLIWAVLNVPYMKKLLESKTTQVVGLFLSLGLLSLLYAIFIAQTVDPSVAFVHWVRRIQYLLPLFVGWYVIRKDKTALSFYLKLYMMVILISFVYGFGQKYFGFPIIITQNAEYSRGVALFWREGAHVSASFAGHYDLASYLVMLLPIFISIFVLIKEKYTRIALAIVFFAGLWLLVNSASRISLVSYLGSGVLALGILKKYKWIPVLVVLSVIFIGFSSNLLVRYGRILEVVKDKISYTIDNAFAVYAQDGGEVVEDRSTSIRLNVEWPRAIRAFKKNPLTGTGYSSITLATDNNYLRILGEVGLLGLAAFTLIFARVGTTLLKVAAHPALRGWEKGVVVGFIAAVPGILLNATFIDIFAASKFAINFWLLSGFIVGLAHTYEKKVT